MAQSMGMHRDGDGFSLVPYEAEIGRRMWWQIISLDMKISEDRGCEPMLSECCFDTRLPFNMDDEDYTKTSQYPFNEKQGVTKMTLSLINMEVARTTHKLHFIPPKHSAKNFTFQEKEDLADKCIKKIDSYFLSNYDPTNPYHLLVYKTSRIQILKLRLVVLYPMQRMTISEPPPEKSGLGLRYVVELLTITDSLYADEYAKRFDWHFRTSVSWHPIAVALAELCTEPMGELADEAWRVIDKYWARWSSCAASSQEEKMWRPVKRLLKRAREARQRSQSRHQLQALSLSEGNGITIQSGDGAERLDLLDDVPLAVTLDDNIALDYVVQVGSALDPHRWDVNDVGAYSGMDMADDATMPMDWDEWNAFIYDAGNLDADLLTGFSA